MFKHKTVDFNSIKTTTTSKGRYYHIDDISYPSITTVLNAKEKPWLKEWQNMLGEKKAKKESQRCADRGTNVHLMCEKYLQNEKDIINNHETINIKMFNQMKFRLNKINNIKAQEIALYSHKLKIAGRVDCIGEYDKVLSAIDFKTSNKPKNIDIIEDYFLQGTFYAIAFSEMYKIPVKQVVILIGIEKSIMSQVFVKPIDQYIVPLLERTKAYHNK